MKLQNLKYRKCISIGLLAIGLFINNLRTEYRNFSCKEDTICEVEAALMETAEELATIK